MTKVAKKSVKGGTEETKGDDALAESTAIPAEDPAAPPPKYNEGDKVYASDGGQLYDSKVLKQARMRGDGGWQYFLHYMGWNTRWDKWVNEENLLPDTDETRAKQKKWKLGKNKAAEAGKPGSTGGSAKDGAEEPKKKKLRIDVKRDTEDDAMLAQIKLAMPFTLKKQLVDDWEWITVEPRRLVPLPRKPTAAQVIEQFLDAKKKLGKPQQLAKYQELMDGLKIYFDKGLPAVLLYRWERQQYDHIVKMHPGKVPSQLYGSEHLLRLFVRLPALLSQTSLNTQEVVSIQTKMADFLKFLQKNHSDFFLPQYNMAQMVEAKMAEVEALKSGDEPVSGNHP